MGGRHKGGRTMRRPAASLTATATQGEKGSSETGIRTVAVISCPASQRKFAHKRLPIPIGSSGSSKSGGVSCELTTSPSYPVCSCPPVTAGMVTRATTKSEQSVSQPPPPAQESGCIQTVLHSSTASRTADSSPDAASGAPRSSPPTSRGPGRSACCCRIPGTRCGVKSRCRRGARPLHCGR